MKKYPLYTLLSKTWQKDHAVPKYILDMEYYIVNKIKNLTQDNHTQNIVGHHIRVHKDGVEDITQNQDNKNRWNVKTNTLWQPQDDSLNFSDSSLKTFVQAFSSVKYVCISPVIEQSTIEQSTIEQSSLQKDPVKLHIHLDASIVDAAITDTSITDCSIDVDDVDSKNIKDISMKHAIMQAWVIELYIPDNIHAQVTIHGTLPTKKALGVFFMHHVGNQASLFYEETFDMQDKSAIFIQHDYRLSNESFCHMRCHEQSHSFGKKDNKPSSVVEETIHMHLKGSRSQVLFESHYALMRQDYWSQFVQIQHEGEHTVSNQIVKGFVQHNAQARYVGGVIMQESAKDGKADQHHRGLLLSDQASIFVKPELYIFQEEVQCSHGSSVGPMEDQWIEYLRSRGLDQSHATQLLLDSLFQWESIQKQKE